MAQITVEITQWLRAPTSSLSQDTPHYSNLNCFHSKKQTNKQTNKLHLHFKCKPLGTQPQCHPTKSTTHPGKQGLQAGTLGAQGPCRANLRNLGQSSACEWASGGSRLQLSPSREPDVRWETQPQFLHLKTRSNNSSTCSGNQTTNLLSKCQLSFPLLPNREWSCALDSGQKTLKGTLWILNLWSETRPWNVNTYAIHSLSPKGSIFTFWHGLSQHSYLSFFHT